MKNDTLYQPKLSASGKIAVALSLAFLGNSAVAANIEALGNTSVRQQNRVDIINIAAPTAQGLSHNQYNKFNVSEQGAVLNNALSSGTSQLAGQLAANSNFQGKAASVILNEVVSKNPSLILGQQEVFGIAADYVLANPNGITHNGGSILNANRASLVVGSPIISNGSLQSFKVADSDTALTVNGTLDNNRVVDLIAPKVTINKSAKINASNTINTVSGASTVNYQTGQVEAAKPSADSPVLDGQIFGSMHAGTIRIHATDERATLSVQNADIAGSRRLNINAAGNLDIKSSDLSSAQMTLAAKDTSIGGTVTKTSSNNSYKTTEAQRVAAFHSDRSSSETFTGSNIKATGTLTLNNTGDVDLEAANIEAGALSIAANNLNSRSVTTTKTTESDYNRNKGSWFNYNYTSKTEQDLHQTKIKATSANINTNGKISLEATELSSTGDIRLAAEKGIELRGNSISKSDLTFLRFQNETAALKTGTATKSSSTSTAYQTKILASGDIGLVSANDLTTYGSTVSAGNNIVTDVNNVNLGTQITANTNALDDSKKYWGGLGGADSKTQNSRTETLHGSTVSAGANTVLGAKNDVNVYGSTVQGRTGAFVSSQNGNVMIQSATSKDTAASSSRTGTIFNITTSKKSSSSTTEKVNASTLASNADLTVVSNKNINIIGSALTAAQKLGIYSAGDLTIAAANADSKTTEREYAVAGYANANVDEQTNTATAKAGITFTNAAKDTQTTALTGSVLTGNTAELNSNTDLTISGSQVNGVSGLSVSANGDVNIVAQKGTTVVNESKRVTDLGVSATASYADNSGSAKVSVGISSTKTNANTVTTGAQVSNLNTGGNAVIVANGNITQEGSIINASGDVFESAQNVAHTAAQNTTQSTVNQSSGGISISAGISTSKGLNADITANGEGGNAKNNAQTASVNVITASNAVVATTGKASDEGTQYATSGAVDITAGSYTNTAAHNTTSSNVQQGGATLSIGVGTMDGSNIDVDASLNVAYANEKKDSDTAVKGSISAGDVSIKTSGKTEIASDIAAANNINISAGQGVTVTESVNTSSTQGTSVSVGVGVGAKVNVETGAVLPKGSGSVAVNTVNESSATGTGATIAANNVVAVTANDSNIALQGTNLAANTAVVIDGKQVSSTGTTNTTDKNNVSVSVNGGYAVTSANGGFSVNVTDESSANRTANTIQSNEVVIAANSSGNGLTLNNTAVNGNNVSLENKGGDILLNSQTSTVSKNNVAVGMSAGVTIDTSSGAVTPSSFKTNLTVDKEQTATVNASNVTGNDSVSVNAQTTTLNASNINTQGSYFSTSQYNTIPGVSSRNIRYVNFAL